MSAESQAKTQEMLHLKLSNARLIKEKDDCYNANKLLKNIKLKDQKATYNTIYKHKLIYPRAAHHENTFIKIEVYKFILSLILCRPFARPPIVQVQICLMNWQLLPQDI